MRLEERLDEKTFFRANRKHIVNLRLIDKIEPYFNGGLLLELKGGEKIEVSRRPDGEIQRNDEPLAIPDPGCSIYNCSAFNNSLSLVAGKPGNRLFFFRCTPRSINLNLIFIT